MMDQQHIDSLLEHYLSLLDEHTRLRVQLSQLQSGVYQNIARANFSGERGMRYGEDHYDERMQASRLLTIDQGEKRLPIFTIAERCLEGGEPEPEPEQKGDDTDVKTPKKKEKKNRNPLHWFGLFAPMPLRAAQTQSIQAVEDIIPRLATVNAEMLNVEIEVRRARKRRAKAEAAAEKEAIVA